MVTGSLAHTCLVHVDQQIQDVAFASGGSNNGAN